MKIARAPAVAGVTLTVGAARGVRTGLVGATSRAPRR